MLIPEPKRVRLSGGHTPVFRGLSIAGGEALEPRDMLRRKLWDRPELDSGQGFPIRVLPPEPTPSGADEALFREQGYRLTVEAGQVLLRCAAREALGYGLATLKQLLEAADGGWRLPLGDILDWPSIGRRSLSNCLTWYSGYGRIGFDMQLFGYAEWSEFLNTCADLKLNQLNLCIYGYWPFPMPQYPESEFRDVRVRLYNPEVGGPLETTFTHPNLADEFLSRLLDDAHRLGMKLYAYMGLNSYSGGYPCVRRDKRMVLPAGSPYINDFDRLCFSKPENRQYLKDCIRRVVQLGFDGIDFEESEEASWFCDCPDCRRTYLAGGATPSDAMFQASFTLFREVYDLVKAENPDCVVGLRAFRQEPLIKSPEEMEKIRAAVPEDVVFFWSPGLYVPDSEFHKWIDTFGKHRIVGRDTESNGISACFGRLIRTFRSNGLRCASEPLQQYIEEDIRQHREAARLGVAGSNGFLFEWYGFFLHLMVHANYPWGGEMDPDAFCAACCDHLYGADGPTVLRVLRQMLTIHESQLNLFPQYLPFAAHKVTAEDLPRIQEAQTQVGGMVADLQALLDKLERAGADRPRRAHIRKLLLACRRNAVLYEMARLDLALLEERDPARRRPLLLELDRYNDEDFRLVRENFFDVYPMETTGIRSCMIPCHELRRVIHNELEPEAADDEMIYLGVEALGWL